MVGFSVTGDAILLGVVALLIGVALTTLVIWSLTRHGLTFDQASSRMEAFPWSKAVIMIGIFGFIATLWLGALISLVLMFFPELRPPVAELPLLDRARDLYRDALNATLWCMGVGAGALIGKRATAKPEVLRAQAEIAATSPASLTDAADAKAGVSPPLPPVASSAGAPVRTVGVSGDVLYAHPLSTGGGGDESDGA